jgi:hypothetical protein
VTAVAGSPPVALAPIQAIAVIVIALKLYKTTRQPSTCSGPRSAARSGHEDLLAVPVKVLGSRRQGADGEQQGPQ